MQTANSDDQAWPSNNYLLFWGKARAFTDAIPSHPIAYHCLDVAASGRVLLEHHQLWREQLGELLQINDEDLLAFVTFSLAMHDIGKFSQPFQSKAPQHWPTQLLGPYDKNKVSGLPHHDTAGWWMWRKKIETLLLDRFIGLDDGLFDPLMKAVVGHHGTPPKNDLSAYTDSDIGGACIIAAQTYTTDAAALFLRTKIDITCTDETAIKSASWALAGLTTLADWIGSNQSWFNYIKPSQSLAEYWQEIALPKAQIAVAQAGLTAKPCAKTISYNNFFIPHPNTPITPSPMQYWAEAVPLADGPGLYLIEDTTGSGKTEAALMLAHRLMAAGKADGLFFALPTQATANAMYARMGKAYAKLFEEGAMPSLILAHGARDLSEKFTSSILQGFADGGGAAYGDNPDDSNITASAQCSAWIADNRRLAFLADVGAGTVDQALLCILPTRHQALRLAGLMRRVLILDEVHAYDAYMQQEINTLLAFHKALGGSTILLSATLPNEMREQLCKAYGGEAAVSTSAQNAPYPMATVASDDHIKNTPIEPRKECVREVPVRFLPSAEEGMERVRAAAKEGQAVLYIRNTVNDAIATFDALSNDIENVSLFHARFAFCDRLRQEENAVETFGKQSKADARHGQILVATQVVEQSLDIDFDLIVSDLAPIDLLIQRAGRLWRHERTNRPGKCEFLVVSPAPIAEPNEKWLHTLLPGTAAVYKDHARLWLTAKTLQEAGSINSPDNLRVLIESVYGIDAENNIPEALVSPFYDFEGQKSADKSIAKINCLKLTTGYTRDGGKWDSDEHTPTRLGDPTTTFRIAREENGCLIPWATEHDSHVDEQHLWQLSEVQLSTRLADDELIPAKFAQQAKTAKETWGKWQDDKKLLVLAETGTPDLWEGVMRSGKKEKSVTYSRAKGLLLLR